MQEQNKIRTFVNLVRIFDILEILADLFYNNFYWEYILKLYK